MARRKQQPKILEPAYGGEVASAPAEPLLSIHNLFAPARYPALYDEKVMAAPATDPTDDHIASPTPAGEMIQLPLF